MYALVVLLLLAAGTLPAQVSFATKIAGTDAESAAGIARDPAGNYYITGTTQSFDFPATTLFTKRFDSSIQRIDGFTTSSVYPPSGRELNALAADVSKPGTLYALFGTNGFKTTDSGLHWQALDLHFVANDYPLALAVSGNTVYAYGTQTGVLRSSDGGATFVKTGPGPNTPNEYLGRLAIDPFNADNLVLSTSQTAFRSYDGGATWQALSQPLNAFAFDPRRKDVVFGFNFATFYKSTDGGQTWTSSLYPNAATYPTPGRLAPDPSNTGTIYALQPDVLLKSTNDGLTWAPVKSLFGVGLAIDPKTSTVYVSTYSGIVQSTDNFTATAGSTYANGNTLVVAPNPDPSKPASVYVASSVLGDGFVAKLDPAGKLVWATILGGSGDDTPVGIAADATGVYVTGNTSSSNFPGRGAALQLNSTQPFVTKIALDGSRILYSRVFETLPGEPAGTVSRPSAGIAVDSSGAAYLALTPQTQRSIFGGFTASSVTLDPRLPPIITPYATVLKLSPDGATIVYATSPGISFSKAIAVNAKNEAFLVATNGVWKLDADGKAPTTAPFDVGAATLAGAAIATDGSLLLTGTTSGTLPFKTTAGAFQSGPFRPYPALAGDITGGDGSDAFVIRLASDGTTLISSTRLGGESIDAGTAIASDSKGNSLVGGTTASYAFPTRGPSQGLFNRSTSFAAKVSPDATQVLFSTFTGDSRPFIVKGITVDAADNPVIVGHTGRSAGSGGVLSPTSTEDVFVAAVNAEVATAPRLDAVLNAASLLADPIAPEENIVLRGARFGAAPGRVLLEGNAIEVVDWQDTQVSAHVPSGILGNDANRDVHFEVEAAQQRSNSVVMPAVSVSPALYTVNQTGIGQGLILNQDGTVNSTSNPAEWGSIVSILANGMGVLQSVGSSAVPSLSVNVYIGGFYANGVDANLIDVPGLPGKQFAVKVIVPNQTLPGNANYVAGPEVAVILSAGGSPYTTNLFSQGGVSIAIKPPSK